MFLVYLTVCVNSLLYVTLRQYWLQKRSHYSYFYYNFINIIAPVNLIICIYSNVSTTGPTPVRPSRQLTPATPSPRQKTADAVYVTFYALFNDFLLTQAIPPNYLSTMVGRRSWFDSTLSWTSVNSYSVCACTRARYLPAQPLRIPDSCWIGSNSICVNDDSIHFLL